MIQLLAASCLWTLFGQISMTTGQNILEKGVVIPKVICKEVPEQSYALYLPSYYEPESDWPVIIAFDPQAQGSVPVDLFHELAERYGTIVAGSNNSRAHFWKSSTSAVDAIWLDLKERFNPDPFRVYLCAFSSSTEAIGKIGFLTKKPAALLMCGGVFDSEIDIDEHLPFAVVTLVGQLDYHLDDARDLDEQLTKLKISHHHIEGDYEHQWPNRNDLDQAMAWLEVRAQVEGLQNKAHPMAEESLRATLESYVSDGRYLQAEGLANSLLRLQASKYWTNKSQSLDELGLAKPERRSRKKVSSIESPIQRSIDRRVEKLQKMKISDKSMERELEWWKAMALSISSKVDHALPETKPMVTRLLDRLWREPHDMALRSLSMKDYSRAQLFARIAVNNRPKSAQAWFRLARAYALNNQPDEALPAIKSAIELGYRSDMLTTDPDFNNLQSHHGFQNLARELAN